MGEILGYRPAVGVMLVNKTGKVWVGQRLDNALDAWQMPQGGLDKGEAPLEGALRELEEETGIRRHLVEQVAQAKEELYYDLPPELIGKVWKKNWRGQRQTSLSTQPSRSRSSIPLSQSLPMMPHLQRPSRPGPSSALFAPAGSPQRKPLLILTTSTPFYPPSLPLSCQTTATMPSTQSCLKRSPCLSLPS